MIRKPVLHALALAALVSGICCGPQPSDTDGASRPLASGTPGGSKTMKYNICVVPSRGAHPAVRLEILFEKAGSEAHGSVAAGFSRGQERYS